MPQILFAFAFEFECDRPNDLCMAKLPFGCSEIFIENGYLAGYFKIKNIYILSVNGQIVF